MDRREFIRSSCTYCLAATVLGIAVTELNSCSSVIPVYKTSLAPNIEVPLTSFLQNNEVIVRPSNSEYDILLVKKSERKYTALLMECTHRNNSLVATEDGLYCPAHGSRFDLNGNVTQQPATEPLKQYQTSISQTAIIIHTNS